MRYFQKCVGVVFALVLLIGLAAPARADEVRGTIMTVDSGPNQLIMQDTEGNELTFCLGEMTRVFIDDTEAELADLRDGDEVTVTYFNFLFHRIATEVRAPRR